MRRPCRLTIYALTTVFLPLLAAASFAAPLSFGHAMDRNFTLTEGQLLLLILPTPILFGILGIILSEMLPAAEPGIRDPALANPEQRPAKA